MPLLQNGEPIRHWLILSLRLQDGGNLPRIGSGNMQQLSKQAAEQVCYSLYLKRNIRPAPDSGACYTRYPVEVEAIRSGPFLLARHQTEMNGIAMFSIIHADGSGDDNPEQENFSELYDELVGTDREHGDVSVVHDDTGWSISAHRDGRVVLEHLREGRQRHMIPVGKERVLELWQQLILGDIEGLLKEDWKPGYV
jgi:hypothetical protein